MKNFTIMFTCSGGGLSAELRRRLLASSKYNIKIIALHIDAFYTNSDNFLIPVMQALRIVSLMQDGESEAANLRLLRSQQKFKN